MSLEKTAVRNVIKNRQCWTYAHSLCSGSQWTDPHHSIAWAKNVCDPSTVYTGPFQSNMERRKYISWRQACKASITFTCHTKYSGMPLMALHSNQFVLASWVNNQISLEKITFSKFTAMTTISIHKSVTCFNDTNIHHFVWKGQVLHSPVEETVWYLR